MRGKCEWRDQKKCATDWMRVTVCTIVGSGHPLLQGQSSLAAVLKFASASDMQFKHLAHTLGAVIQEWFSIHTHIWAMYKKTAAAWQLCTYARTALTRLNNMVSLRST